MNPTKIIQTAWKGLNRNKLRSMLTMLGVIIGVAAVIIMVSVSTGTETTIKEKIEGLGSNLVFIQGSMERGGPGQQQPSNGGLVYTDAAAISDNIKGVTGVSVEQAVSETAKAGNVTVDSVTVLGTTPDFPQVRSVTVANGRYFTQTDLDRKTKVAVLGYALAKELFGDPSSAVGQTVKVGSVNLSVVGVMAYQGTTNGTDYSSYLFTPITVIFEKFNFNPFAKMFGDRVRMIYVQVDPKYKMADVIYQIKLLLVKRHAVTLDSPDFTISTQDDIIATQESATSAFRNLLGWVAGVSLLVGGIGIMNIMLVSVTERTHEIGIRQSVGATPSDVRWQFLTEALLLSLFGGLVGIAAGLGGSWLFGQLGSMRTVVAPASIVLAFFSAAAVGIFFGFYPANKAAQLDPIEALRHE